MPTDTTPPHNRPGPQGEPAPHEAQDDHSALAPLRLPAFRMLWLVAVAANTSMWMNDVAAAWLMTSLSTSPVMVALVQTASTLPVFLLGLPSGALADILDRRRYFLSMQIWATVVALLLCITIATGHLDARLLLLLTFANGIGLAMRWPVFAALIPEIVPRHQLPAGLALNAVAMNASRISGPLLAGAILASAGSAWVFVLNAVLSVVSAVAIFRWKHEHHPSPLGREKLTSAMRVGMQFVAQSTRLKGVLLRTFLFFFNGTALVALMPLLARDLDGGGAGTFTVMLASMGGGAIVAAMLLPRLRGRWSHDGMLLRSSLAVAAAILVVAVAPNVWVAVPAMICVGMAWITAANTLSVSAQLALPDWVRARGMSMFQMAIMGASALGAATWGQVASLTTVHISLGCAAVACALAMVGSQLLLGTQTVEEDLTRSNEWKPPVLPEPPQAGKVLTTIEYLIDPKDSDTFRELLRESRRSRLRQGALECEWLEDLEEPGRFVEQIIDESWTENLRRFDRVTAHDVALRERKLAFHQGAEPPRLSRFLVQG